mgnify:CR=1 FL=1
MHNLTKMPKSENKSLFFTRIGSNNQPNTFLEDKVIVYPIEKGDDFISEAN